MKLIKAKTTKRFGGSPYITLPKNTSLGESQDSSSSMNINEVASYLATIYEEEETIINVDELPVINSETPPSEGNVNAFYRMDWGVWMKGKLDKQGSPTPLTVADITWRAPDDSWGCHFGFFPVCILNDDFDILVKVFHVYYTD